MILGVDNNERSGLLDLENRIKEKNTMNEYNENTLNEETTAIVEEKEETYQQMVADAEVSNAKEQQELKDLEATVDKKEEVYQQVVANAETSNQQEHEALEEAEHGITNKEEEIVTDTENLTQEQEVVEEIMSEVSAEMEAGAEAVDVVYDGMAEVDDRFDDWAKDHTRAERQQIWDNGYEELTQYQIDLTAVCDKAKEDYETLKNAVEQYSKDYDEEAYQQAVANITTPVINTQETNQACDKMVNALQGYSDTQALIEAVNRYKAEVQKLDEFNFAEKFNELYNAKNKYDAIKAMKEEVVQKQSELEQAKAEYAKQSELFEQNQKDREQAIANAKTELTDAQTAYNKKVEEYIQNQKDRQQAIETAKAELDKAVGIHKDVQNGIYNKVEGDNDYARYNELVDAYLASLEKSEEEEKPADNTILKPMEVKAIETVPAKISDGTDTATYSGVTGYAMTATVALVTLLVTLRKSLRRN